MVSATDLQTRNRLLYGRLYVAQEDLRQAKYFVAHILKKGWHFQAWERRWTTYMQQSAFTTALVIAYARPFVESRGWPRLPKRLAPYSKEQKALHNAILELRKKVYAHSDIERRNLRPFDINGEPSAIETLPEMRLTKGEAQMLSRMIDLTYSAICIRLKELVDLIE